MKPKVPLELSLCPVSSGVQFVHQHLMVHGDIKRANVLVSEDGSIKLLDFGISRLLALPQRKWTICVAG